MHLSKRYLGRNIMAWNFILPELCKSGSSCCHFFVLILLFLLLTVSKTDVPIPSLSPPPPGPLLWPSPHCCLCLRVMHVCSASSFQGNCDHTKKFRQHHGKGTEWLWHNMRTTEHTAKQTQRIRVCVHDC